MTIAIASESSVSQRCAYFEWRLEESRRSALIRRSRLFAQFGLSGFSIFQDNISLDEEIGMSSFKHTLLRAQIFLLLLVGIAAGQQLSETPASPQHKWGPESDGFQLSIWTDKGTYRLGEPVGLTSTLKNVGETPARVELPPAIFFYQMAVKAPAVPQKPESSAALTPYARDRLHPLRFGSVAGYDAPPGHEITDEFELSRIYDMSIPGIYKIRFSCKLPARNRGKGKNVVNSNYCGNPPRVSQQYDDEP